MDNNGKNLDEPYDLFGIECGTGWAPLVRPVIDYVKEHNEKYKDQIKIYQIKEKWGRLEIYLSRPIPKELEELVEKVKKECSNTCELCGSKTDLGWTTTGWVTRMCRKCSENIKKNYGEKNIWRSDEDSNKKT